MVTNRHIAEPWWKESSVDAAVRHGFEPHRTVAHAYFPRKPRPVDLRLLAMSEEADIAVLALAPPEGLAALALSPRTPRVSAGDLIVVLSYPTGFDALLAKADPAVAREIDEASGEAWPAMATALATRGLITPLVTEGHVGDLAGNNLVYDAATAHGSSGGPVLNAKGEVIAVNDGGLEEFAGARFGIPVRFIHRLLNEPDGLLSPEHDRTADRSVDAGQ